MEDDVADNLSREADALPERVDNNIGAAAGRATGAAADLRFIMAPPENEKENKQEKN